MNGDYLLPHLPPCVSQSNRRLCSLITCHTRSYIFRHVFLIYFWSHRGPKRSVHVRWWRFHFRTFRAAMWRQWVTSSLAWIRSSGMKTNKRRQVGRLTFGWRNHNSFVSDPMKWCGTLNRIAQSMGGQLPEIYAIHCVIVHLILLLLSSLSSSEFI